MSPDKQVCVIGIALRVRRQCSDNPTNELRAFGIAQVKYLAAKYHLSAYQLGKSSFQFLQN